MTLDTLLALPEIGGPVGYSGWTALGTPWFELEDSSRFYDRHLR